MTGAQIFGYTAETIGVLGVGGIFAWFRYLHRKGISVFGRLIGRHLGPVARQAVADQMKPITEELKVIAAQMEPNGGGSMRDDVTSLKQWAKDTDLTLKDIQAHLGRQDEAAIRHLEAHAK